MDRQTVILKEIAFAASEMARAHNWRDGIDELLARLGKSVNVSRVFLFEVEYAPDGRLMHSCRHDWCTEDLERLAHAERYTQECLDDYDPIFDEWVIRRRRGEMIQGHTRDLTGVLREDFEYQKIKSYVSIPILLDGEWWGHLGFDDCVQEREWETDELHLLQTTAALIGASAAREQANEQMRSNDALRAAMLDVALDSIIMLDEGGRVLEFNPAAEKTFGYRRDQMLGRQINDMLVPKHLRQAHKDAFAAATQSRAMRRPLARTEMTALRADGREFPIELTVTQIDRGHGTVYAAFIRDLTDRKASETRLRAIERERANLARFFSQHLVEQLIEIDTPLSVARSHPASVLFVDMIDFTSFCTTRQPAIVIRMLRDLHAILSQAVFAHSGTIYKFLGDGLMAVFGSPIAGPNDATNAARCALEMSQAVAAWNVERKCMGDPPIEIAIGIAHGDVVMGDIGSERHLELTILGDTVNVASRVEGFCRSVDAAILVTDAFVTALAREGARDLAGTFRDEGWHTLRGRKEPVHLYGVRRGKQPQARPIELADPNAVEIITAAAKLPGVAQASSPILACPRAGEPAAANGSDVLAPPTPPEAGQPILVEPAAGPAPN